MPTSKIEHFRKRTGGRPVEAGPPETEVVEIFSDGACLTNPGRGGYAVVLLNRNKRLELSGGFRRTTNNRMELMAVIVGLETLHGRRSVRVYTDSKYVQESMIRGWVWKWRADSWRKKDRLRVNYDLWDRLLRVCDRHAVEFEWIRGHFGHTENERCDFLATQAANDANLPAEQDMNSAS